MKLYCVGLSKNVTIKQNWALSDRGGASLNLWCLDRGGALEARTAAMPKEKGSKTWRTQAREAPKPAEVGSIDAENDGDAIMMAAMQGNVEHLGTLLDSGGDPDGKDAIGVTPLHWAAFCGHAGICTRLLQASANVAARDQEGRTPLHVASYESHAEVIQALIAAGADLLAPDKMGWTPLHCAVSNGQAATCKQLIEAGADPLCRDSEGKSAMDLAKHFGNESTVSLLEGTQEAAELLSCVACPSCTAQCTTQAHSHAHERQAHARNLLKSF
jgi:ankyrin repeat protein